MKAEFARKGNGRKALRPVDAGRSVGSVYSLADDGRWDQLTYRNDWKPLSGNYPTDNRCWVRRHGRTARGIDRRHAEEQLRQTDDGCSDSREHKYPQHDPAFPSWSFTMLWLLTV